MSGASQILHGHTSDVTSVDFNGNKVLVSSSNDKTIRIWKANEDGVFKENTDPPFKSPLIGHRYGVNCVRFSPLGTLLASASTDGYLYLWDCQTAQQILRMPHHTSCPIRVCSFSPSSAFLATAGDDEKICLWDISSRSLIRTYNSHEAMVTICVFSPDSTYIISGSTAGDLKMWDARYGHGKCLVTVNEAHDLGVLSADFNTQYEINSSVLPLQSYYMLASCGNDDLVKIWQVKGGLQSSITLLNCLAGHSGNVYACKFSRNGSILASVGYDKSIILWWVESGAMLHRLDGHYRFVTCCAFSADDSLLATGSNDKTVIIWNLSKCLYENGAMQVVENHNKVRTPENRPSKRTNVHSNYPGVSNAVIGANVVSVWKVDQVCSWLETLDLKQYRDVFSDNQIDGIELLHLSHDSLLNVLKITSFGHRNKILRAIQALRNPSWQNLSITEVDDLAVPEELCCPITHELMKEPVVASDGYSYELEAITKWLSSGKNTSPMTNEVFKGQNLVTNRTLKLIIKKYALT